MRIPSLLLCLIAHPAMAQLRPVPVAPINEREALNGVEVILLNESDTVSTADAPRSIEVTAADGTRLVLERVPGPAPVVAPGAFAKARYVPVGRAAAIAPPVSAAPPIAARWPDPDSGQGEREVATSAGTRSGFLDRFAPHEPIYGVFGVDDAGAKLQASFAFRPFDGAGALDHLRFAYSQTMFWRIDRPSGPFQNIVYSPELYVESRIADDLDLALGYRHDSNGAGPDTSIDVNRIYLRAAKRFDLGSDWRLELVPQAWFYVGDQGVAPDLEQYWGYTSLTASLLKQDGLKLSLTGRGNVESGRGAADAFVSYPLQRLGGEFGIYLFGQAFTGYGESLDDYRRSDTHARIGIALTR